MRLSLLLSLAMHRAGVCLPDLGGPGARITWHTAARQVDPVTVRGCVNGRRLRITDPDTADRRGVREVRLKGGRTLMRQLDDSRNAYVEVIGQLELPPADRIETRRKQKTGSRTTVGARAGQSEPLARPTTTMLAVEAFTPLGDTCPAGRCLRPLHT